MTQNDIVKLYVKGEGQYIPNHARMTSTLKHETGLKRGIDRKIKDDDAHHSDMMN